MPPLDQNREQIESLCRRYGVRRLAAFGSILRPDFDPARSGADFLVEFDPVPGRPVDLVEDGAIRNPYILKNLAEQQQVLYAA